MEEIIQKPTEWGRWVESVVGAHFLNAQQAGTINLYYWRNRNEEVDFIVECRGKLVAIEVKSGRDKPAKGLSAFDAAFSPQQLLLVGDGGIPVDIFLETNPAELIN